MKITLSFEKTQTKDTSIMVDALRASTTITLALNNFNEIIPCNVRQIIHGISCLFQVIGTVTCDYSVAVIRNSVILSLHYGIRNLRWCKIIKVNAGIGQICEYFRIVLQILGKYVNVRSSTILKLHPLRLK